MKRKKIAILFDSTRKYDRDVMTGIARYTAEYLHWSTFLVPPQYMTDAQPSDLMKMIHDWKPDGIITRGYENWELLKTLEVPLIISSFDQLIKGAVNLSGGDISIANLAASYYIKKGFRKFAFIGHSKFFWSENRRISFQSEIEKYNFPFYLIPDKINQLIWHKRPKAIAAWLKHQKFPLAVFAASDEFAQLVLEAIQLLGLRCPYDIALLGVDNDESICELTSPKISSIDQNAELAGYLSAQKLQELLEGNKDKGAIITVPAKCVIERKSTDLIAVKDKNLQQAISYIKEQAIENNINVQDVTQVCSISRRLLEMRFKKALNISILAYIKKVRIDHIKKLLLDSNLSIKEIAAIMDFTNLESIARYFKIEEGMSPSEYRKTYKR